MTELEDTEEIDYMSDDFLVKCTGANDIRPGLGGSHSTKRKYEIEKKKMEKDSEYRKRIKPSELRDNRLQEGLATAIDSSNKGFSMLQKMGYKPGMSLGKEGKGRLEPVGVELKSDRKGLGWKQIMLHKREQQRIRSDKEREKAMDPNEYRARLSNKHHQKLIEGDLWKIKKVCYSLDQNEGLDEPHEKWFWPNFALPQDNEEDDASESGEDEVADILEPADQLDVLTIYLRETYLYCLWCGQTFDSTEEIASQCPGSTRADHD